MTSAELSPLNLRGSRFWIVRRTFLKIELSHQGIGQPKIVQPKNANGGAENRVVLLRRKHLRINGFHPEGPSRSDEISLMLSRLRRFDSRHSRF